MGMRTLEDLSFSLTKFATTQLDLPCLTIGFRLMGKHLCQQTDTLLTLKLSRRFNLSSYSPFMHYSSFGKSATESTQTVIMGRT